jgi:hypothetical protein
MQGVWPDQEDWLYHKYQNRRPKKAAVLFWFEFFSLAKATGWNVRRLRYRAASHQTYPNLWRVRAVERYDGRHLQEY